VQKSRMVHLINKFIFLINNHIFALVTGLVMTLSKKKDVEMGIFFKYLQIFIEI